jgi:hypothetical protein
VWLDAWNGFVNWERTWDWGSVPDWVGGVGTAAAFIIAALGYFGSVRTRKSSQAKLVYARLVKAGFAAAGAQLDDPNIGSRAAAVRSDLVQGGATPTGPRFHAVKAFGYAKIEVLNNSKEMLSSIDRVEIVENSWSAADDNLGSLEPGKTLETLLFAPALTSLLPTAEAKVTFTDAQGTRWARTGGRPIQEL